MVVMILMLRQSVINGCDDSHVETSSCAVDDRS